MALKKRLNKGRRRSLRTKPKKTLLRKQGLRRLRNLERRLLLGFRIIRLKTVAMSEATGNAVTDVKQSVELRSQRLSGLLACCGGSCDLGGMAVEGVAHGLENKVLIHRSVTSDRCFETRVSDMHVK